MRPYLPVLRHPLLRRLLPGLAVSALGDGMAVVAIAWLAVRLAPEPGRAAAWVALAVAAYALARRRGLADRPDRDRTLLGLAAIGAALRRSSGAKEVLAEPP